MSQLKDLVYEVARTRLYSVNFNYINNIPEDSELLFDDHFKTHEICDNRFSFLIERHVYFNPASSFDIKVAFLTERYMKDEFVQDYKFTNYDIEKEFYLDPEFYTDFDESWLSVIISQLTASFGNSPLILPPKLFLDKQ